MEDLLAKLPEELRDYIEELAEDLLVQLASGATDSDQLLDKLEEFADFQVAFPGLLGAGLELADDIAIDVLKAYWKPETRATRKRKRAQLKRLRAVELQRDGNLVRAQRKLDRATALERRALELAPIE